MSWSAEELKKDAAEAKARFRRLRLDEPRHAYETEFNRFRRVFAPLLDILPDIAASRIPAGELAELFRSKAKANALRYTAAPPISSDDLATLAETNLSATHLRSDSTTAKRVQQILSASLDRKRFPWVFGRRAPSASEREAALVATSALYAASFVATLRRSEAKRDQENAVKECLEELGFEEVHSRRIDDIRDAPKPGEYCGESRLGETKADFIVVLRDRRIMPIECKVSNSEVNSFKRLVHEAAGKAVKWTSAFGRRAIVPAAVLSGCYKVENLVTAQNQGLAIYWTHDLKPLRQFLGQSQ